MYCDSLSKLYFVHLTHHFPRRKMNTSINVPCICLLITILARAIYLKHFNSKKSDYNALITHSAAQGKETHAHKVHEF